MSNLEKRIKNIVSHWFITEPLLFGVQAAHSIIPNPNLNIPVRSGKMRIEYSPKLLEAMSDQQVEFYLKNEVFRIMLGHPYARLPLNPRYGILSIASDVCIYASCYCRRTPSGFVGLSDSYGNDLPGVLYLKNQAVRFGTLTHPLGIKWEGSEELKFFQRNLSIDHYSGNLKIVDDLSFEQWYRRILFLVKETAIAGEDAGKAESSESLLNAEAEESELWEENQEAQQHIKDQIKKAEADAGWGGIGGEQQRAIKDSADFSFDYRRALTHFRQSIVTANRTLTRMRPNRRYGFSAMGSRYERKANILIAVDVSGSITDESFEHFTHAIKNFFFLKIIEKIDLIFFDVNLKNRKPVQFRKKIDLDKIKGRGGTNFQPAFDFFEEHKSEYSGLIIFTDGEGNIPVQKYSNNNILWILDSRLAYEKNHQWINTLAGNKSTYLPF